MHQLSDYMILIPSYEPDEQLPMLLEKLKDTSFAGILIVDDGSGPAYRSVFDRCRTIPKVTCIDYETNHGKGYALKYGFNYLLEKFPACQGVITADSDGQHLPKDIVRMGQALAETPEQLILGARNCLEEQVPLRSKIGNRFTRWLFRIATGISVQDTQTGLRALSRASMEAFLHTAGDRFEYEMNMLGECRQYRIKMREIPIETVYIGDNKSTHFRTVRDALRVGAVFLKFLSSSLLATLVDYGLFLLLLWLLHMPQPENTSFTIMLGNPKLLIAFFSARTVSSVVNFILNKKIVFHQKGKTAFTLVKYFSLVIVVALLTYLLMALFTLLHIPAPLAQPMATLLIFCISYLLQRKFVFK